jgi:polar amino acid transport system permease protein
MYFVLPLLGVFLPALMAGIVACGFNLGAYGSEVVRASVQSVGREQREAAKALNYTNFQLYRYVLIPQAIPVMIPSFGNLVIELLKLTAVASLITISDLTFMSQIIRVQTALTLEPLILIMVIYFILSSILVSGTKWLERYFSAGRNIHKSGGN